MHQLELREAVLARMNRGEKVASLAVELKLPAQTLFHWRRQARGGVRRKRPTVPRMCSRLWAWPDPHSEAAALLQIADSNGGREGMRTLIAVTPSQKRILERLAAQGQVSPLQVHRAIDFREQVLEHFDRLADENGDDMPKVAFVAVGPRQNFPLT